MTRKEPHSLLAYLSALLLLCALLPTAAFGQIGGPGDESGGGAEIEIIGPLEDGRVVYQRIARPGIGDDEQGRISIALRVVNTSAVDISVDKIRILGEDVTFFGSPRVVAAGSSRRFQNAVCPAPELPDLPDPDCFETLPLVMDDPVPTNGTVEVYLTGYGAPLTEDITLAPHTNDGGPLRWAGKFNDLRTNETWGASSHHGSDHQVFALDTGVLGWDGENWTETWPGVDATEIQHYRAYGMPVFAMADGTVCWALNDHEERPDFETKFEDTSSPTLGGPNGGGNEIFLQVGDEVQVIAHLQRGSIPAEFLIPGATVKQGQYLGKVGFSGASSHPHTHLHVKTAVGMPAPPNQCDSGEFRPMAFQDMQSVDKGEATGLALQDMLMPVDWMEHTNHSAPDPYGLLYPSTDDYDFCDDCTDERQYIGVWREGSHIELKVKIAGWPGFVEKWDDLSNDSFRLVEINTFVENGERQYLGVFQRGDGDYALWQGRTWDEFQNVNTDLEAKGLRLVDMDTFDAGGVRYYVGVWRQGRDQQKLWRTEGWDAFTAEWETLGEQGLRLVDIETYLAGSGNRVYVGIWREGGGLQGLLSVTGWDAFIEAWTDLGENYDLRLVDIETFPVPGDRQFLGVWRPGTDGYVLESHTGYDKFWQASEVWRFQGLRLVDIHVEP